MKTDLEVDDEVCDLVVPFLFQMSQDSGPEEDLGLSDSEQVRVELQRFNHLLARLLAVHEALRDGVGSEQLVALSELLSDKCNGLRQSPF